MRDLLANLLARLRATNRQQRLYLALGAVLLLVVGRFALTAFLDFRSAVKDDVRLSAQRLTTARRLAQRAPESAQELDALRERYRATVAELVPGDTPTLAAASLQERVSGLAGEKGVSVQTTQVLKDEPLGPFRQVSLRITASGELHDIADFLSALEFGPLRVGIPFIELSRRGAVIRRQGGGRNVSATIQISGIVQGTAQLASAAPQPEAEPEAPPALGEAAPAGPQPPPPPAQFGQRVSPPGELPGAAEEEREPLPEDPLGTGEMVTPQ